jgi:hypothetical protein
VTLTRDNVVWAAHEGFNAGSVINTVILALFLSALLPSIVSDPNSELLEADSKKYISIVFKPGFLRTKQDHAVAY